MTAEEFILRYEARWQKLEAILDDLARSKPRIAAKPSEAVRQEANAGPDPRVAPADFPELYRQVCHHLALARDRHYPADIIERLNRLVLTGHQFFYAARVSYWAQIVHFAAAGFPALIRQHARLFWLSAALFYLPLLIMGGASYVYPEMVYTLLDQGQVADIETMYRPSGKYVGRPRNSDSDFFMFGIYIYNNISISFQTFAGGMLFGVGSMFYLIFNGLFIGAVAGHLTQLGYIKTFYPFVVGHGAFELTAIIFAGMAGLKLGFALIFPGQYARRQALVQAARISIKIIYGSTAMLVIAAFIEAFWSSTTGMAPVVKYIVGGLLWAGVISYFLILGRPRAA